MGNRFNLQSLLNILTNLRLEVSKNYMILSTSIVIVQQEKAKPNFLWEFATYVYEHPFSTVIEIIAFGGTILFLGFVGYNLYQDPGLLLENIVQGSLAMLKGFSMMIWNLAKDDLTGNYIAVPNLSTGKTLTCITMIVGTTIAMNVLSHEFYTYVTNKPSTLTAEVTNVINEPIQEIANTHKSSTLLEYYTVLCNFIINHWFSLLIGTMIMYYIMLVFQKTEIDKTPKK